MQVPEFDPHQSKREGGRWWTSTIPATQKAGTELQIQGHLEYEEILFQKKKNKQVIKGGRENGVKEKG